MMAELLWRQGTGPVTITVETGCGSRSLLKLPLFLNLLRATLKASTVAQTLNPSRQRQVDFYEFKTHLVYLVSSSHALSQTATKRPELKTRSDSTQSK